MKRLDYILDKHLKKKNILKKLTLYDNQRVTRTLGITRTHTAVWLEWETENLCGKQLLRSSRRCQLDSDESESNEGSEVFNSSRNLCKSDMCGIEGRQVISSECILCRSAFLNISCKCCRVWKSMTFGIFIAVYIVRTRKTKNPIKCLKHQK